MGRVLAVLAGLILAFAMVFLLVLLLLWLWRRREREAHAPAIEIEASAPEAEMVAPARVAKVEALAPEEPAEADDLKLIEGIGPKISGVLQAAGITTFAQLAATDVSRIGQILEEESLRLRRLADPTTWPEQAQLAADSEWEALEALQRELKGGRRT
ncbi:MAG: hypothetical protein PVH17_00875 [Anaerolineae bacterium]|jgi:predicted flap endonuclease-1-like 5' DNA nuclease